MSPYIFCEGRFVDRRQIRDLAVEWAGLAAYFRYPISDQVCGWYASDLADLPFDVVIAAMAALRCEPGRRFLPMPADVRERASAQGGQNDSAVEIAGRIRGSLNKFGYTKPKEAKAYIGPIGWTVIEHMGGWQHLCQTLKTSEINTFYAQCRELCRAGLTRAQAKQIDAAKLRSLCSGAFTLPSGDAKPTPSFSLG